MENTKEELQEQESLDEQLSRMLRRSGHFMFFQSERGQQQNNVLKQLVDGGPQTQKSIQEQMHVKPGTISEMLSKMENRGMIVRERDPKDRRRVLLTATEKGRKLVAMHKPMPETQRFTGLTQEEKNELLRLLSKLTDSWRKTQEEKR